ncbi:Na(+)/H(+) antiporter subunit C [Streptomyces zingiberis]|uniref:Na(+)/H(+) antiporter subunit C n=1 Tax=Streptomyces zingiberis TaxID=2053010 RepID=A0ABX1BVS7_9ACTN|nr:Na(+)/H(+) antiporter subunit C [Streptomyces zingiberis]NJQ00363.1 Na(+)/H(+) antiporter subunit C [Streptomyces zingiberis]
MNAPDITQAVVVGGLFATGFLLMTQRSLIRIVLGFLMLGHGTNLLLLSAGSPGAPPVTHGGVPDPRDMADPLPQAMALTSIVITFGLTTFLLALAYRSWRLTGHDEVRDDVEDRRIGTARERARADGDGGGGAVDEEAREPHGEDELLEPRAPAEPPGHRARRPADPEAPRPPHPPGTSGPPGPPRRPHPPEEDA